jgi:hypothetical protein
MTAKASIKVFRLQNALCLQRPMESLIPSKLNMPKKKGNACDIKLTLTFRCAESRDATFTTRQGLGTAIVGAPTPSPTPSHMLTPTTLPLR